MSTNPITRHKPWRLVPIVAAAWIMAGCSIGDQDELKQWMAETRRDMRPIVTPIPEPKKFEPYVYSSMAMMEPFNRSKIDAALEKLATRSTSGFHPDLDRRREPLEAYPIDTIKMVGTLRRGSNRIALLQIDRGVYQAIVGNYAGQNFGRITAISEGDLTLKETVQDASGEWVERITTLQLQENK
ncbi:pilus assembly protein PilP [soil metagenome]